MFAKICNYLFKRSHYEDEDTWVNRKLNEWIVDKFSNNKFLSYIPNELITKRKNELKIEYRKLFL